MEIELTKDVDKVLCVIYKIFLERRKSGQSLRDSRRMNDEFYLSDSKLSSWHKSDINDSLMALGRVGYLKIFIAGDFDITDSAISYMENRFKNGFLEVAEFLSNFIP